MGDIEVDSEDDGEEAEHSLTNAVQAVTLSESVEQRDRETSGRDNFSSNTPPAFENPELNRRMLKGKAFKGRSLQLGFIESTYKLPDLTWALHRYLKELPAAYNRASSFLEPADLANFTANVYNQIQIPVPDFQNKSDLTMHHIRSTPNWRGTGPRKDCALFLRSTQYTYGALAGRGVCKVELAFKLTDPFNSRTHNLAFITELQHQNGGHVQDPHGFVLFHEHPAIDYSTAELQSYRRVVNIKSLLGAAHMIELEPSIFLLNTHVDLTVYNAIY
jgi:hypothetical protein